MIHIKTFGKVIGSVLLLGAVFGALSQRQNIHDWWQLRDYQPSQRIAELAGATSMSDQGRKLFYVHDPQLSDKITFRANCDVDEVSIVLGCYLSHRAIYILDVDDPRLKGVHEVTAAHEMLHAAYDRLDGDEQKRVNSLTAAVFEELSNQRLTNIIQRYQERDPEVVPNELHSILATEVRQLSPELEAYYSQYFTDRQKVVGLSEQYESAFTTRNEQIAAFDVQLSTLKQEIESLTVSLEKQSAGIAQERTRIDILLQSERFDEYNAAIPGFNARVRAYNNDLGVARRKISEYNVLIGQRNAIAVEEQELLQAIDTRTVPEEEE